MAYWSSCSQIYHFYAPLTICNLIISNLVVPNEMQISCHRVKLEMPRKLPTDQFVMTLFNVTTSNSQPGRAALAWARPPALHVEISKTRPPAVCHRLPPPVIIPPPTRVDCRSLSIIRQLWPASPGRLSVATEPMSPSPSPPHPFLVSGPYQCIWP